MHFKTTVMICAALILSACGVKDKPGAVIQTPQGPVQGVVTKNDIQNVMGIPYAAPPIGDLRWRPPEAAPNWTDIRSADTFSAACMQDTQTGGQLFERLIDGHGISGIKRFLINQAIKAAPTLKVSEDCLYLNVRTPNIATDGSVKSEPLPVMVWIHGGSHQFGSSDTSLYQSDGLPLKGIVLVTINYRLGPFGYLAHPAIAAEDPRGVSGNYGTLDQVAALEWVRDNISAYGGDPDNVTIFGESAGAWSVTELMTTPLAEGLFHRAIGQSGASTYHLGQMTAGGPDWMDGYESAAKFDENLGLNNPDAEALRALSADDVMKAGGWDLEPGLHHVRDGVVFPKNVGVAFRDGAFNSVPTLFGYNADETTIFYEETSLPSMWIEDFDRDDLSTNRRQFLPHYGETTDFLLDTYNLTKPESVKDGIIQMSTDEFFGMNVRYVTQQNEAKSTPSYLYIFNRVPPNKKQYLDAFHIAEIPFFFDSHIAAFGVSESDEDLTDLMTSYWVNFTKTGNPNGPGLPDWPSYQDENWMQFGGNNDVRTGVIKNFRKAKLDALEPTLIQKLESVSPQSSQAPAASGPPSNE